MRYFLITTAHNAHSRHEYIKQHLALHYVSYTPILATNHEMYKLTALNPSQTKQQSLTLAYYQIAQTAIFQGLKNYIVLEDDISFQVPISKRIKHESHAEDLSLNTENFGIAYLTKTDHNAQAAKVAPQPFYDFSHIISNWWETPYTLWSLDFAKYFDLYISEKLKSELWLGHIDHELMKICEKGEFKFFGSDIQTAIGLSSARNHEAAREFNFEGSISQ